MGWLLWIILILSAAIAVFKIYWKLATKWSGSYACLINKTAIVTGANAGIGYITALDFAKRGARVILACRNKDRAEDARKRIIKATGNQNVVNKLMDAASLQSVRDFAADINNTEDRIDILVNNAGIGFVDEDFTVDGLLTILHVNHITPFLLTNLLIDKLKKSGNSRIVNVSSRSASEAKLDISNLHEINVIPPISNKSMRDVALYSDSKLCNILFTIELAKKLGDTGVKTNVIHPGATKTEFLSKMQEGMFKKFLMFVAANFFLTAEEGAQTQIYLSVSKDVEGVNGKLFANCTEIELYKTARNPELAKHLWHKSEELAKLKDSEKLRLQG